MEEKRAYAATEIMGWRLREHRLSYCTGPYSADSRFKDYLPEQTYGQLIMLEERVYGSKGELMIRIRWDGELIEAFIHWSDRESGDTEIAARFNLVVKVHKEG